jgi:ABC-type nitrate/sulfonate/bicarbonate transport system substrate-binding protein
MLTKTYSIIIVLLTLFSGSLVACNQPAAPEPAEVSVRLKWLHQTQFAGIYLASPDGDFFYSKRYQGQQ